MERAELEKYILDVYGIPGEYLFARNPSYQVFRHSGSRKWFAVLMDIPGKYLGMEGDMPISVVNFKCDPRLIGSFRLEDGIYPAWHMNKAHWLTVALDGRVDGEKVRFLLEMSFELTK